MPRVKPDPPLPWERQPEDSDQSHEAFVVYRDMLQVEHDGNIVGRRSQREVARRLGKSSQLIDRWAIRHAWVERVRAYDADLDRDRIAALRGEAIKAVREHAQIAHRMVLAIAMPLEALFQPQRLVGPSGHQLVNEDGEPLFRDRTEDIQAATTPELLLLLKQLGTILPVITALRMQALGNPNEPLPELPEYGSSSQDDAPLVSTDRMLELLRAADEAGLLDPDALGLPAPGEPAADAVDAVATP